MMERQNVIVAHRLANAVIHLSLCMDLDRRIIDRRGPEFHERHAVKQAVPKATVRHVTMICVDQSHPDALTWDEVTAIMASWPAVASFSVYDYPARQGVHAFRPIQALDLLHTCTTIGVYWYGDCVLDLSGAQVSQQVRVRDRLNVTQVKVGRLTSQVTVESSNVLREITLVGTDTTLVKLKASSCYSLDLANLHVFTCLEHVSILHSHHPAANVMNIHTPLSRISSTLKHLILSGNNCPHVLNLTGFQLLKSVSIDDYETLRTLIIDPVHTDLQVSVTNCPLFERIVGGSEEHTIVKSEP